MGRKLQKKISRWWKKNSISPVTDTFWEYDFHQFREKAKNVNREAVEKNPEKYLEYEPQKEKTLEQKVQEQEETIRMLTSCLLEMSEAVYA
jgi:hypothetical protein